MTSELDITPTGLVRLDQIVAEIRSCIKRTGLEVIVIGQRLTEARDILYGGFGAWVEEELNMSDRMARNFMYVAHRFANTPEIISAVPPTVLYSLAAPSTPDKVIDAVFERVKTGEVVHVREVKAMLAEHHNGRRSVAEVVTAAVETVKAEVVATGGHVSVNGESIAGAITEDAAESLRIDGEVIRQRIEAEQGLDGATAIRGKATVDYVSRDGRVTLYAPELANQLRSGQHITFIIYPKD